MIIVYLISCSGQNSVKFLLCAVLVSSPTPGPPHQPAENCVLRDRIIIHVQAALSPSLHYDWSFEFCSKLIGMTEAKGISQIGKYGNLVNFALGTPSAALIVKWSASNIISSASYLRLQRL